MSFTNIQDINNEVLLQLNDRTIFKIEIKLPFDNNFWLNRFKRKYGVILTKNGLIDYEKLYKKWIKKRVNDIFTIALENRYLELVNYILINIGTNLIDKDNALILASRYGYLDVVKKLVSLGANINSKDYNDESAIQLALENGHLNIVTYLVSLGVNIPSKALIDASQKGYLDLVMYLVSLGVNKVVKKDNALHIASLYGRLDIVKYLVSVGVDIHLSLIHI